MNEPRMQIISRDPLCDSSYKDKTMSSLLSYYDKDNIAQLYFSDDLPDMTVCSNFYRVTDYDILNALLQLKKAEGKVIKEGEELIQDCVQYVGLAGHIYREKSNGDKGPYKLIHSMFLRHMPSALLLRDLCWNTHSWDSAVLKKWLSDFNPQIMFFKACDCGFEFNIAFEIANRFDIPLIMMVTDDYVTPHLFVSPYGFIQCLYLNHKFKRAVKRSSAVLAASDKMRSEYEARFGGNFKVFMNDIDVSKMRQTKQTDNTTIRFLCACSLDKNRWRTLAQIVRSLAILREEGIGAQLDIYCDSEPDDNILSSIELDGVSLYRGSARPEELSSIIDEHDVLVYAEAFDLIGHSKTSLSLSAEIPEYLSKGKPILAVGPKQAAAIGYLSKEAAAIVVTSKKIKTLKLALREIALDADFRNSTSDNAFALARRNHSKTKNQGRLREIIRRAIKIHAFKKRVEAD